MFTSFKDFLAWEQASRDTIDVKRSYVDIAGDLAAGVMLSQIIFYYLPGKNGESKLRVERDGFMWMAKKRNDWWEECRLTPDQVDRCTSILKKAGVIETARYKFQGSPVLHIRLLEEEFLKLLDDVVNTESVRPRRNPLRQLPKSTSPNGEIHFANSRIPSTETTYIDNNKESNGKEISSLYGGRLKITDNGINADDEWEGIVWTEKGASLHVGSVVTVPKKKPRKRRTKKPADEKKTYGVLPYEVQEKYKEIFFPKDYDMNVQRLIALGQAKQFVETALKYDFDDPVGLMDVIGKEVNQEMITKWPTNFRRPTIARLLERIGPLAQKTGRL